MTKEEFLQLQELQRNSGLPLMKYLDHVSDRKAVEMACLTNYSNGMMEGTVNKIKEIKRTMFNRAGIELLRAKVIYANYGNVIT